MINANRNLDAYAAFGVPVWPDSAGDTAPDFAGPLAGFLCGLAHCATEYLVVVPCDAPFLPADLVSRLAQALAREGASVAWASAPSATSPFPRSQPVFCLMKSTLHGDLAAFLARGGRKVEEWTTQQSHVVVPFEDAEAFFNANTLDDL
jgi:molybdopterin-guanine dinucleotide biosynthesis protein A